MGFDMLQSRARVTRIIKYARAYIIGVGACQGEELPFFFVGWLGCSGDVAESA